MMGGTLHLRLRRPEGQDHGGVRPQCRASDGRSSATGRCPPGTRARVAQCAAAPSAPGRWGRAAAAPAGRRRVRVCPAEKPFTRGAGVQDAPVQLLCVRHKGAACRRQHHTGGAALEQRQIQLFFQTADLVAECGLGAVQLLCGGGKVQCALHGQKNTAADGRSWLGLLPSLIYIISIP